MHGWTVRSTPQSSALPNTPPTSLANLCLWICLSRARVEAGDEIVELESSKAVQPLISPVVGTVKYVNRDVADDPSVVNGDPYGEGWLLKVELDDDEPELLSADEYARSCGSSF